MKLTDKKLTARYIAEQWKDSDGYWIALKYGWQIVGNPSCHTIVENTKHEALAHYIRECACDECVEALKDPRNKDRG